MKMLTLLIVFTMGAVAFAADDATDQAAQLEQLLAEVQQTLPAGWSAEITPTEKWPTHRRTNAPGLVVYRHENVQGYYDAPNPGSDGPETQSTEVMFMFTAMPYLTQPQYRNLKNDNETRGQTRLEFEKKLKDIPGGYMGANPWPPGAYEPADESQRNLIRQYAFVWLNTEPHPLPNYSYNHLSFDGYMQENLVCEKSTDQKELATVRALLLKLLNRYEAESI